MDGIVTRTPSAATAETSVLPDKDKLDRDNLWTLAALGSLAYVVANVLHEGLGHGGVAWLSGAHTITVTSTYMEAGLDTRWILAAGTLVNLVAGVAGLALLHGMRRMQMPARLFVWLVTAFNLLLGTGYFLFSGIGGIGDWAEWMKGLTPLWAWRVGFAVLGAVSYWIAGRVLSQALLRIVNVDGGAGCSESRMRRMTTIPYIAGALTACIAGVWNPLGWKLVLISAAASSFGGASGLLWIPGVAARALRGRRDNGVAAAPLPVLPWLLVGAGMVLVMYVCVLGPGITLHVGP